MSKVVQMSSEAQSKGPVIRLASESPVSVPVPVVAPDGSYGNVQSDELSYYLQSNPGAQIAPADVVARKEADRAEAQKELNDPYQYRREQLAKREAEIDALDDEMGLLGLGLGAAGLAAGPIGVGLLGASMAENLHQTGSYRNPIPSVGRGLLSFTDAATGGGLTSAAAYGAGLFGGPQAEQQTQDFVERQKAAPGWMGGSLMGSIGATEALAGKIAPALAALGERGAQLGAQALAAGVEGSAHEATESYLQNRETSAQKILMSGVTAALTSATAGYAAGKAIEGLGAGARGLGKFNESLFGKASQTEAELAALASKAGQDWAELRKTTGVVNSLHTAEDIAHASKQMDDIISRESRNLKDLYKSTDAIKNSAVKASVNDIRNEILGVAQEYRNRFGEEGFAKTWGQQVMGAEIFLKDLEKASVDGFVSPDKLSMLKKGLDGGKYSSSQVRSGAKAVYNRLESKISEGLSQHSDEFANLAASQKRLDLYNAMAGVIREGKPTGIPTFMDGVTKSLAGTSSFNTALSLAHLFGSGSVLGTGAILGKAALEGAYNTVRRAVPNAVAGQRLAAAILSVEKTVQTTAQHMAHSILNTGALEEGARTPKAPTREEFDAAVQKIERMLDAPPDMSPLSQVDPQLGQTASSMVSLQAQNALGQLHKIGKARDTAAAHNVSNDLLGQLTKPPKKPKELQPSELEAWDYIRTLSHPLETLREAGKHRISNQSLAALRENYPDVLGELQDQLVKEITAMSTKSAAISLDSRAYLSRVLGRPVDISTDPRFANAISSTLAQPPQKQGSPSPSSVRGGDTQTESEKLEN